MATKTRQPAAPEPSAIPAVPWFAQTLNDLLEQQSQLHHALLIHGPSGIGKSGFAASIASALLCETNETGQYLACGQCQACHWFTERSHPDYRGVLPEANDPDFTPARGRKPSREIRIDQVRALARFMAVGSHRNGWKIVCINPADAMNHITANALLKTLEEPASRTLLLLVSSHPDRLPATVRSRCRQVKLAAPPEQAAVTWIAETAGVAIEQASQALAAAGAPLHALALVEPGQATAHRAILEAIASLPETPVIGVIDALDSHDPLQWAQVLRRWVGDLARVKANSTARFFPDWADRFQTLAQRTRLEQITSLQRQLGDLDARIEHPLNPRLICESTVLAYNQLFEKSAR